MFFADLSFRLSFNKSFYYFLKDLFYLLIIESIQFIKISSNLFGLFLSLLSLYFSRISQVILVTNKNQQEVMDLLFFELQQPLVNIGKAFLIGDVVNNYNSLNLLKMIADDGFVLLLASCIPYLNFQFSSVLHLVEACREFNGYR